MIIILSPSKTFNKNPIKTKTTNLSDKTFFLFNILSSYDTNELVNTLNISKKLSDEVYGYYKNFKNEYYAVYLYGGTAFKYLDAFNIPNSNLKNLYFLSAFYGLINSFDAISKYRLDLKDKIIDQSLENYWFEDINSKLINLKANTIINLSSGEYSRLLDLNNNKITTINFGIKVNNKITSSSMMLKKMRGLMANHLLKHNINSIEEIKKVTIAGFKYSNDESTNKLLMFIKEDKLWN